MHHDDVRDVNIRPHRDRMVPLDKIQARLQLANLRRHHWLLSVICLLRLQRDSTGAAEWPSAKTPAAVPVLGGDDVGSAEICRNDVSTGDPALTKTAGCPMGAGTSSQSPAVRSREVSVHRCRQ